MGITTLSSVSIQPTKPQTAFLQNNSPVSGTYYTALNLTANKGIIARITITALDNVYNYILNNNLNLRITVDGGSATTIANSGSWLRGKALGNYNTTGGYMNPIPQYNFTYESPIYFTKSILIEASATGTLGQVNCLVDYSIV